MPVRKQDAYRALELLEEYYNRLDAPEDKPLKDAIDRVIKVFKSRLFQALIDIQEFYESILLDESSDRKAKMNATHHLAEEWENQPMLKREIRNGGAITTDELPTLQQLANDNPLSQPSISKDNSKRQPTPTPFAQVPVVSSTPVQQNPSEINVPTESTPLHYDEHWKEIEIDLERLPGVGLGFSIAGGIDTPCISNSSAVVVTRITEGGLVSRDKRLRLHDIILRVNDVDFTRIDHQPAVDALKAAGNQVHLSIRRLEPSSIEEIVLDKPGDAHLGFSIAGGISHEHVKGDHGIFITNIIPGSIADKNGRLKVGDRLMSVQSAHNIYNLEFVEHRHAVESVRHACKEGDKLTLTVSHFVDYSANAQIVSPNRVEPPLSPSTTTKTVNPSNGHPSSQNEETADSSAERRLLIRRGPNGFGFNVTRIDNEPGIFISFIQAGGAADKSGELRQGDRILSVNNTDLRDSSHENAVLVLKNCGETANLVVINKTDEHHRSENRVDERPNKMTREAVGSTGSLKTSNKRQFFVRAEFDYDPTKDPSLPSGPGLAFHTGDILCVTNAVDDSWWQAKRVTNGQGEEERGIIPSKSRVVKKERARQKRVNFNQGSSSRSSTLDREKKKKRKFGLFNKPGDRKDAQSEESENELETFEPVPAYESITQHEIDYARPVVIFGAFKEILNDQLLNNQPEKFANCVPHTSRPKRDKEVEGREYFFVPTRAQMEKDIQNYQFIEAGEYGGNLYGTSTNAVRDVSKTAKHCILDVSGHAIKRLIAAGLYPIVIFVKPRDVKWVLENMEEGTDEEGARQTFEKANKVEEQFSSVFTVTVEAETLNDVYERICDVIEQEETVKYAWIPTNEKV